jgi:hypothetical protein
VSQLLSEEEAAAVKFLGRKKAKEDSGNLYAPTAPALLPAATTAGELCLMGGSGHGMGQTQKWIRAGGTTENRWFTNFHQRVT